MLPPSWLGPECLEFFLSPGCAYQDLFPRLPGSHLLTSDPLKKLTAFDSHPFSTPLRPKGIVTRVEHILVKVVLAGSVQKEPRSLPNNHSVKWHSLHTFITQMLLFDEATVLLLFIFLVHFISLFNTIRLKKFVCNLMHCSGFRFTL